MEWEEFPALAKAGIVVSAILTAGLAAVSVALSYDAAYHLVLEHGHYSPKAAKVYPLILDAGFLIAEFAAIVATALRPLAPNPRKISRYPFGAMAIMTISGVCSIWINMLHVDGDKVGMLIAALPPVFMILTFNLLVAICRWVAHIQGYNLGEIPPVREVSERVAARIRRSGQRQTSESGQAALPGNSAELSKAEAVRSYLWSLKPTQLHAATKSSVARAMADRGVAVDETWASRILSEVRPSTNGKR